MGGQGSGSWYRYNTKTTTDTQRHIDIRWLKKNYSLEEGTSGTLSWSRRGDQTGAIRYRTEKDRMVLDYHYRRNAGEWVQVEESICFDRTPCHYGGNRLWFLCPDCHKRVAVLYGAGKYFLCRYCYDLTYSSQQESHADRFIRKARKVRKRLGEDGSQTNLFTSKPKHMHWQTYWRLRENAEKLENLGWSSIFRQIGIPL